MLHQFPPILYTGLLLYSSPLSLRISSSSRPPFLFVSFPRTFSHCFSEVLFLDTKLYLWFFLIRQTSTTDGPVCLTSTTMVEPTTTHPSTDASSMSPSRREAVAALRSIEVVKPKDRSDTSSSHRASPPHRTSHKSRLKGQETSSRGSSLHGEATRFSKTHSSNSCGARREHGRTEHSPVSPKGYRGRGFTEEDVAALANAPLPHNHEKRPSPSSRDAAKGQIHDADTNDVVSSTTNQLVNRRGEDHREMSASSNLSLPSGTVHCPHSSTATHHHSNSDGQRVRDVRESWQMPLFTQPYPATSAAAGPLNPTTSGTSSGHHSYPFFLPSFANTRMLAGGGGGGAQGRGWGNGNSGSGSGNAVWRMSLPATSSNTRLASSVPVEPAARTQLLPQPVQCASAVPYQRRFSEGRDHLQQQQQQQQLMSNNRRPWQSVGEWNLGARAPDVHDLPDKAEDVAVRPSPSYYGRRPSYADQARMQPLASGASVGSHHAPTDDDEDAEPQPQHFHQSLRGYAFPSMFGDATGKAASPHQSLTVVPTSQPSGLLGGMSYAGASVMWHSSNDVFATVEEQEEQLDGVPPAVEATMVGGGGVGRRGEAMTTASPQNPQSSYGLGGAVSCLNAWYSFLSPTNLPPHTAFTEEGGAEAEVMNAEEPVQEAVTVAKAPAVSTSLGIEPPLPEEDEDEDARGAHAVSTTVPTPFRAALPDLPLSPARRGIQPASRRGKPEGPPLSPPTPRAFTNQSSFFVVSTSSFRGLSTPSGRGEDAFFDSAPNNDADTQRNAETAKAEREGEGTTSAHGSDTQLSEARELDRKETMYGRRWLQETGKGGIEEGSGLGADKTAALTSLFVPHRPVQQHPAAAEEDDEESNTPYSYSDDSRDGSASTRDTDSHSGDEDTVGVAAPHLAKQKAMREREEEEEEVVVDGALLHRILSGVEQLKGDVEDEDYSRAYPTAPAPMCYPTRRESQQQQQRPVATPRQQQQQQPPPLPFNPGPYTGRSVQGYPYRGSFDQQQQQQRYNRYSTAAQSPNMDGFRPVNSQDNSHNGGSVAAARVAMYAQTFARERDGGAASPASSSSPTGRGVAFRQTAVGPLKVHVMLGFDPEMEIQTVRSPLWSRLPSE